MQGEKLMYRVESYYYRMDNDPNPLYQDDVVEFTDIERAINEWCTDTGVGDCECNITADSQEEAIALLNYVVENIDNLTSLTRCKYPWTYIITSVQRTLNRLKSGITTYKPNSPIGCFSVG